MVIQRSWKILSDSGSTSASSTEANRSPSLMNSSSDDSNCSNQTTHSMVTSVASPPPQSAVRIEITPAPIVERERKFVTTPQMAANMLQRVRQRLGRATASSGATPDCAMRSLELLRMNVQDAFDTEVEGLVKRFIETYFKPAFQNIKENLGDGALTDDTVQKMSCALVENTKTQFRQKLPSIPIFSTINQKTNQKIHQKTSQNPKQYTNQNTNQNINQNTKPHTLPTLPMLPTRTTTATATIHHRPTPRPPMKRPPPRTAISHEPPRKLLTTASNNDYTRKLLTAHSLASTLPSHTQVLNTVPPIPAVPPPTLLANQQPTKPAAATSSISITPRPPAPTPTPPPLPVPLPQPQPQQQSQPQPQPQPTTLGPNVPRRQIFWNTANISVATKFVLDVQANQAFGFGTDGKERLASKHPVLIRYLPDTEDREWLISQNLISQYAQNSRFLFLIYDEVIKLYRTQALYRNKPTVDLSLMRTFTVPERMIQKMKHFFVDLNIKSRGLITNSFSIASTNAQAHANSHLRNALLSGTLAPPEATIVRPSSSAVSTSSDGLLSTTGGALHAKPSTLSSSHATLTALLNNSMSMTITSDRTLTSKLRK